jgi:hypothetical protein
MVARNTFLLVENMPSVGNHEKLPYPEVHHLLLKLVAACISQPIGLNLTLRADSVSIGNFNLIFSEDGVLLPDGIPHRPTAKSDCRL